MAPSADCTRSRSGSDSGGDPGCLTATTTVNASLTTTVVGVATSSRIFSSIDGSSDSRPETMVTLP